LGLKWIRRFKNEKFHSVYHSPNIVRVIKSRILKWVEHVRRMEADRSAFKMLPDVDTGKNHLGT
jgi:hypothetical protein